MEQVIDILKEAAQMRVEMAQKEVAFWKKIAEAAELYNDELKNKPAIAVSQVPVDKRPAKSTFLTNKEAAKYLNISHQTLDLWRVNGRGPQYSKIGHLVRYKVEDLDAYIEDNRFPHTSAYKRKS